MNNIEVICGDALEEMQKFPDGSFSCVCVDPPYWTLDIHRSVGTTTRLGGGLKGDSDPDKFFPTIGHDYLVHCIQEFDRLLPKNAHCWIMCDHLTQVYILGFVREARRRAEGGTDFTYSKLYPVLKRTENGAGYKQGLGYHGRGSHEYAVLLEKGRRKFSDSNWPDVFEYPWIGAKESQAFTPDGKPYPTAKPVALYERLITLSTTPGERVLDPFAGSGAAGQAAKNTGRDATLIDIGNRSIKTMTNRFCPESAEQLGFCLEQTDKPASGCDTPEMVALSFEWDGGPKEDWIVPSFNPFLASEAKEYAAKTGGFLYTWKSEGIRNWLVEGQADFVECFCFVVMPKYEGSYLSLLDDEETRIDNADE